MAKFIVSDPRQPLLLVDLREWVPSDELSHFVLAAVERESLDHSRINERGAGSALDRGDAGEAGQRRWRSQYRLRKQTIEPVFRIIKNVLGFRQFTLRGHARVHDLLPDSWADHNEKILS